METLVTWIEGEPRCRYKGILMTDDNHRKMFGFAGEAQKFEDGTLWVYDDDLGKTFVDCDSPLEAVKLYIINSATEEVSYTYDNLCDEHHGFVKDKILTYNFDIQHLDDLDHLMVMPYGYKDKLNLEEYWKFFDLLP